MYNVPTDFAVGVIFCKIFQKFLNRGLFLLDIGIK